MSRYSNTLQTGLTREQAQGIIDQYMRGEGFEYREERGEMVWRKGVGALVNPQFIKAEPGEGGAVLVEAWTAGVSLMPGVYGGEIDPMHGVYGAAVKAALKPRVIELERRLGGSPAVTAATSTPADWYPDPVGGHELRYWDGQRWTEHVSDNGVQSADPLPSA
jgi:sugar phosphate isomerase/epimerase